MNTPIDISDNTVLLKKFEGVVSIVLNRPKAINSLNIEMIRLVKSFMRICSDDPACRLVVLCGAGAGGFCAGGDIKSLAASVREGRYDEVMEFLRQEYELDLMIHRFKKPVVVIADGVTMGGGLGLAAGADIVIATERTRMAMPEARIGFFPDVGATGWLFSKCPPGYPEFIALTGYESGGHESVRLGLAAFLIPSDRLPAAVDALYGIDLEKTPGKHQASDAIRSLLRGYAEDPAEADADMDRWVRSYFHKKNDLKNLLSGLSQCASQSGLCRDVFIRIAERSPTALVLTLALLRRNEGRALEDVFKEDLSAAEFITRHHDYYEGVRARLIDKDDDPKWEPGSIDEVDVSLSL